MSVAMISGLSGLFVEARITTLSRGLAVLEAQGRADVSGNDKTATSGLQRTTGWSVCLAVATVEPGFVWH